MPALVLCISILCVVESIKKLWFFTFFFFFPLRKTFQLTPELSSPSFWCLIPENQHLQDSVLTLLLNEH